MNNPSLTSVRARILPPESLAIQGSLNNFPALLAQIKAADIKRNSANLRAMNHVISQVAGKVTRDIEKAIEMRF